MTTRPETCPLAETDTLLWLYGEGPEDHAAHVAGCADCTAVAQQHADVAAAVMPLTPQLKAPTIPSVEVAPEPVPAPANRGWMLGVVVGLAVAAAVLLGLFGVLGLPGAPGSSSPTPIAEVPDAPEAPLPDELAPEDGQELVQDDPPRQVAPMEDVDPELLIEPGLDDSGEPQVDPEAPLPFSLL